MDLRNVKPTGNFEDRTGDTMKNRFYEFLGQIQAAVGHYAVKGFDPNNPNNPGAVKRPNKDGIPDYERPLSPAEAAAKRKSDITAKEFWTEFDKGLKERK